jgi:hypothetical protein
MAIKENCRASLAPGGRKRLIYSPSSFLRTISVPLEVGEQENCAVEMKIFENETEFS